VLFAARYLAWAIAEWKVRWKVTNTASRKTPHALVEGSHVVSRHLVSGQKRNPADM
jgi:hypothetical protein